MNRLRFDGSLPGDGVFGLGDLLVDAAQRTAGPLMPVLVVDDLVTAVTARPGWLGLGETHARLGCPHQSACGGTD
jgi:hypothetical protein